MKKIILFLILILIPMVCTAKNIFPETSVYISGDRKFSVFSIPKKTVVELRTPDAVYAGMMDIENERIVIRWEACADDNTFANWKYPLFYRKNEIKYNVIFHNQDIIISPASGKHSVKKVGKPEISGKYIRAYDKKVSANPVTAVYFIGLSDAEMGKYMLVEDVSKWIVNKPDKETKDELGVYPSFIEVKMADNIYLIAEDLSILMKN